MHQLIGPMSAISKPTLKKVEAIGKPFNDLARRHRLGRTIKNDKGLTDALASIDAEGNKLLFKILFAKFLPNLSLI